MSMLKVTDLEVYYGMIKAIKGISFEVNQGEVIALIGANGAGKTTILHTVTGLIQPKHGKIEFEGVIDQDTKLDIIPNYPHAGTLYDHIGNISESIGNAQEFVDEFSSDKCILTILYACYTLASSFYFLLEAPAYLADACIAKLSEDSPIATKCWSLYGAIGSIIRESTNYLHHSGSSNIISTLSNTAVYNYGL